MRLDFLLFVAVSWELFTETFRVVVFLFMRLRHIGIINRSRSNEIFPNRDSERRLNWDRGFWEMWRRDGLRELMTNWNIFLNIYIKIVEIRTGFSWLVQLWRPTIGSRKTWGWPTMNVNKGKGVCILTNCASSIGLKCSCFLSQFLYLSFVRNDIGTL